MAHPGGMSLRRLKQFPSDYFRSLMEEACKAEVAIKINSSHHHLTFNHYLSLVKITNPLVSTGSDAHQLKRQGECSTRLEELLLRD